MRALEATGLLTQKADLSGTTVLDALNCIHKLIPMVMLWTVQHHWPAGDRFALNFYKHWVQLLIRQPGEPPVTPLIRKGVIKEDPL